MAIPQNLPLQQYIAAQSITDKEIKQILVDVSKDAERMIALGGPRGAQAALAKQQVELWAAVKDHTMVGIGDAVDAAGDLWAFFDEDYLRAAGINTQWWRTSVIAQARAGIENIISRRENGITLSDRVYKNQALSQGRIDRILNAGLAQGKSAREIARDVAGFIRPDVPGGVSYAAMRLARTELNNAFHTTQQNSYKQNPFVESVFWRLSGSHSKPDECNEYAEGVHFKGGKPGEYMVYDVPNKPHPNCLCFTVAGMMDKDKFKQKFRDGEFDDYIDGVMGCSRVA